MASEQTYASRRYRQQIGEARLNGPLGTLS